jgi:hypothetical protein
MDGQGSLVRPGLSYRRGADGLVWDDLDALDVASRLEDLPQHVLGDAGVESAHVQSALVGLGSRATGDVARASAAGRHAVQARVAGQGRAHGGGDRVRVLRDDHRRERRRRHVLLRNALVPSIVPRGAPGRGRRQVASVLLLVGHGGSGRGRRRRETLGCLVRAKCDGDDEATRTGVGREAGGKESRGCASRPRRARKGTDREGKRGQGDAEKRKKATPDDGKLVGGLRCGVRRERMKGEGSQQELAQAPTAGRVAGPP